MTNLLLLVIYIWPFGQLLSFTHPSFPFTIYFLDLAVFLLFVSLFFSAHRKQIFSNPIIKPLAIFLTVAIVSLLLNLKQGISSGFLSSTFYLLRLIMYPSIFLVASQTDYQRLKKPLLISLGIFCLLSLLQYLIFPDMRYLKYLGFDDHYFRLIGSFYDPNFTGAVLAGVSLYFIAQNKYLFSIPSIVLLGLTFSRASYFAFAVGLITVLVTKRKIKLLLLLALLSLVVFLIPKPSGEGVNLLRTFSIFSRIESWQQGLDLFWQKPLLGWGYNTLRNLDGSRFQIDNSFIYLLSTTGTLGFFAFMNLLYQFFRNTQNTETKLFLLSIIIHSLFNNSFFYIWILALTMFVLGIGQKRTKVYKQAG